MYLGLMQNSHNFIRNLKSQLIIDSYRRIGMYKKFSVLLLLAVIFGPGMAQVQQFNLPSLSRPTQNNLNLWINIVKVILPTYNWNGCDKVQLHRVLNQTSKALHAAAAELLNFRSNYLLGSGNLVWGKGNIVIGNNDTVIGLNNWCFTSDYSTPKDKIDEGILAVSKYKIQMDKINKILVDPMLVISELRPE